MEFPDLGNNCTMKDCQQLDFLPVTCFFCQKMYCKVHFLPFDHSCPNHHEAPDRDPDSKCNVQLFSCTLSLCSGKELVEMPCPHCLMHFCLQHRHQIDHDCPKFEKPQEKMIQTAALIAEIQQKNAEKKPVRQGVKSDKLAAKVQLMKLKQHSKGLTELPGDERIYFMVALPVGKKEEYVFVSKLWSVGKCIDFIASTFQVPNYNNIANKPQLNLFSSRGDTFSEKKDVTVKELIESEVIFNGESVTLKYCSEK